MEIREWIIREYPEDESDEIGDGRLKWCSWKERRENRCNKNEQQTQGKHDPNLISQTCIEENGKTEKKTQPNKINEVKA